MSYLTQSIVKVIKQNIQDIRVGLDTSSPSRRLIYTLPSLQAEVLYDICKDLSAFVSIELAEVAEYSCKIAPQLGEQWDQSHPQIFRDICNQGWYDQAGTMTEMRNQNIPDSTRILIVLLAGTDQIVDAASLADFYHITPETIWKEDLGRSFKSWIEQKFIESTISYQTESVDYWDEVLCALVEYGLSDIETISQFLKMINLDLVQNAEDGLNILLSKLIEFGIPLTVDFSFGGSESFGEYLSGALSFFSYTDYLRQSNRGKAIDSITDFQEAGEDERTVTIGPDDTRTDISEEDLLGKLRNYIEEGSSSAKDVLLDANFLKIREIIKFKRRRRGPGPTRDIKEKSLIGDPVEIILEAIWDTVKNFRKDFPFVVAKEIKIQFIKFHHDCDESTDPNERTREAKNYLIRLIGGLDDYLTEYIDISWPDSETGERVSICSNLEPSTNHQDTDNKYTPSRSSEPKLTFSISINGTIEAQTETRQTFSWKLPSNHPFRVTLELIDWAEKLMQACTDNSPDAFPLPCYIIPHISEILSSRDDEECRRVLLQAIQNPDSICQDLLKLYPERNEERQLWRKMQNLIGEYFHFIREIRKNGLLFGLRSSSRSNLIQAYQSLYKSYNKDPSSSEFGPLLFRCFLILSPKDNDTDYWSNQESSALITILHPCLIELQEKQISYLFNSFNYEIRQALVSDSSSAFSINRWRHFVDLSTIKLPLNGLLMDDERLETRITGTTPIFKVGQEPDRGSMLTTRLLLLNEGIEEEEISDADLFRRSKNSKFITKILSRFCKVHPHTYDGISISAFIDDDVQSLIAGIDDFLENTNKNREENHLYSLNLVLFTSGRDNASIQRWVREWEDRWQRMDNKKRSYYRDCRISISCRLIDTKDLRAFNSIINKEISNDIVFLIDFLSSTRATSKFESIKPYERPILEHPFPILEKSFCPQDSPGQVNKRTRILSNRQLQLSHLHTELMARLIGRTDTNHIVTSIYDYSSWKEVIDKLHDKSGWVVCIDPCIDENLIKNRPDTSLGRDREFISFGSGVGINGEHNFTVSTDRTDRSEIKRRIFGRIGEFWDWGEDTKDSLFREAQKLSGMSLIRATGTRVMDNYIFDFVAYAASNKLLISSTDFLVDKLIPLDMYPHWFSMAEESTEESSYRPDLLHLRIDLQEIGDDFVFEVNTSLIECKFADYNDRYVDKAFTQVKNGLRVLASAFKPRKSGSDNDRPDQRYWWYQLHRLIASKLKTKRINHDNILSAMENLSEGQFSIKWSGFVLGYWKDREGDSIQLEDSREFTILDHSLEVNLYSAGQGLVPRLFGPNNPTELITEPPDSFIYFPILPGQAEEGPLTSFGQVVEDPPTSLDQVVEDPPTSLDQVVEDPPTSLDQVVKDPPTSSDPAEVQSSVQSINLSSNQAFEETGAIDNLSEKRIFLGQSVNGNRKIYWEFGHPELGNRHMLIFGASGMGKSYTIQALLCELASVQQNSLIVDYTEGFKSDQLEEITKSILKPKQYVVRTNPLPINPFRRQVNIIEGEEYSERSTETAQRVASIFDEVYMIGEQQKAVLYNAIAEGINSSRSNMSFGRLISVLEEMAIQTGPIANSAQTVANKIMPFIDSNAFGGHDEEAWERLFSDSNNRCHILQLQSISRNASQLITFCIWVSFQPAIANQPQTLFNSVTETCVS